MMASNYLKQIIEHVLIIITIELLVSARYLALTQMKDYSSLKLKTYLQLLMPVLDKKIQKS